MTPDYAEAVASWLAKAKSDLDTAYVLIRGAELHLDTGSYHCQQASAIRHPPFTAGAYQH